MEKIIMKSLRTLLLTLAMMSGPVHAVPVTYYFGGILNHVDSALAPHFGVGNPFNGSFTFDSSAPDLNSDPMRGAYLPGPAFSATVNGVHYTTTGGDVGSVSIDNNFGGSDILSAGSVPLPAEMQPETGGYLPDNFSLVLYDSSGTALINDMLPLGGLHLDDFNIARFEMWFVLSPSAERSLRPNFASFYGELSYISLTDPSNNFVSEPGSALLLAMGIAALAVGRRNGAYRVPPSSN